MPSISYDSNTFWSNYHLTSGTRNFPDLEPRVRVEELGRLHAADIGDLQAISRFAKTAEVLWAHIDHVNKKMYEKAMQGQLGEPPAPFPAALVGRGWSFSSLIGADEGHDRESMLVCDGLAGTIMLNPSDLAPSSRQRSIALTAGGTRFRELADWAARFGLSIKTSGTHLGATVAGGFGTASHGSRLGFGGLQNMIVGMHIVTGSGESVWIERKSDPLLTAEAANQLHTAAAGSVRILSDDDQTFEDALVHLGCMGIVNCVAIELVPDRAYDKVSWIKAVDAKWLELIAAGNWRAIAQWLGRDEDPVFYEATINPHAWNGDHALHIMYFPASAPRPADAPIQPGSTVADAIAQFGGKFSVEATAELNASLIDALPSISNDKNSDDESDYEDPALVPLDADMSVFDPQSQAKSAYEYYWRRENFTAEGTIIAHRTWRELHGDEITGGSPGSLYNASYAIERHNVVTAIPAITDAVRRLPKSFVFTLRFVTNPAGTMAFTRFPENAVIEIDGLSPWICRRVRAQLPESVPADDRRVKMLRYLEFALPKGAHRTAQALARHGIDYSNHFAKRIYIDKHKVQRDFGPLDKVDSSLMRWRATRDKLLSTMLGKAIFWNWGAVNFGLIDRPLQLPFPLAGSPSGLAADIAADVS